ncbi:hypothetical protein PYW07_007493 [Mythimna separata]|uniref:Uncharacterized protein n=1 Tax=Mythimna separata TaxID=271217 RepID=A0AAD7Z173_MYTSE|nr:hypothetical protein PYW07_007493 [Mythimna separata]
MILCYLIAFYIKHVIVPLLDQSLWIIQTNVYHDCILITRLRTIKCYLLCIKRIAQKIEFCIKTFGNFLESIVCITPSKHKATKMKSLLIIASFVALAVAGPVHRDNIIASPAIVDFEPVAVGPAIVPQPIAVGPAIIEAEPISVGPAMIDFEPVAVGPVIVEAEPIEPTPVHVVEEAPNAPIPPFVQIILNINGVSHVIDAPISPVVDAIVPTPINVVEDAVDPVQVVEVAPEPVHVVEAAPEPVAIGAPQLPIPVAVLPEALN